MQKLPVLEIVRQSYRFLIEERWTILRLSWFLVLIAVMLQAAFEYADIRLAIAAVEAGGRRSHAGGYSIALLISFIQALAISAVAVALHRVILLGYRAEGTRLYFAIGKVEFLFLMVSLAALALVLLAALPLIPLMLWTDFTPSWKDGLSNVIATALLHGLTFGTFAFVSARFSPVLPIAVIERSVRFREAWQLTRGNFWRLFWIWVFGSLPLMIIFNGLDALLGDPEEALDFGASRELVVAALQQKLELLPLRSVLSYVSSLISGAVGVGLLCYSFKALIGHPLGQPLTETKE